MSNNQEETPAWENELDALIRDITKVGFMAKSGARARSIISVALAEQREMIRGEINEAIQYRHDDAKRDEDEYSKLGHSSYGTGVAHGEKTMCETLNQDINDLASLQPTHNDEEKV